MRDQQPARSGPASYLGGLNRGRMAEMMRLFDQLFSKGRFVNQPVSVLGKFYGVRAGSRVQAITNDLSRTRRPKDFRWMNNTPIIECDRLARLQFRKQRTFGNSQRFRVFEVEPAGFGFFL